MEERTPLMGPRIFGKARLVLAPCDFVKLELQQGIRQVKDFLVEHSKRRQGYGTKLMQRVCTEADGACIVLLVHVEGFKNPTMDDDQLAAWYARFGFRTIQEEPARLMVRMPRIVEQAIAQGERRMVAHG